MKRLTRYVMAAALTVLPTISVAGVVSFVVDAKMHSSNMLSGLATGIIFEKGDGFTVSVASDDMWFLGGGTTEASNADGLVNYPLYPQANLVALYGTLVGQIGAGEFFVIGTQFAGEAANDGELFLYNWDSGNSENSDSITAWVTYEETSANKSAAVVPLSTSGAFMISALAGLGVMRHRS